MKSHLKLILQRLLGLETYLFAFAVFRVFASRLDPREAGLFEFIKLIPEDAVVLDVGANIGVTSTIIRKRAHPARLVAFEPLPVNLRALRALFKLFGVQAEVIPCAVGDAAAKMEMMLPKKDGVVLHGLGHLKDAQDNPGEAGETFTVDVIRLDDSRHLWGRARVHAIKLDVENAEALVLFGAKQLLATDRPIIYCELWDNDNRRKCLDLASALGYTVNVFVGGRLENFDGSLHTADNFFFLPGSPDSALP